MGFGLTGTGGIFHLNYNHERQRLHHRMGVPICNSINPYIMPKNIISMLAEHDWYYPMSDDPSRYRQGLNEEQDIRNELQKYKMENVLEHLELLKERVTKFYHQK